MKPILMVLALTVPSIVAAGPIPASGDGTYYLDNGTDPSYLVFNIGGSDGTDSLSLSCQEVSPFFGSCSNIGLGSDEAVIDGQFFEAGDFGFSFSLEAGSQTGSVTGYVDGIAVAAETFTTVGQVTSITGASCSSPIYDLGCEETFVFVAPNFVAPNTVPGPGSLTTIAGGLTILLLHRFALRHKAIC